MSYFKQSLSKLSAMDPRQGQLAVKIILVCCLLLNTRWLTGCSSVKTALGINNHDQVAFISNPFSNYHQNPKGDGPPLVLRSKKGDRSVEVEIPNNTADFSDFVLPIAPEFNQSNRQLASLSDSNESSQTSLDESYKKRPATATDLEIVQGLSRVSPEDEQRRHEVESSLNLVPDESSETLNGTPSYLAGMDHIKQLYRSTRFEAALLETDDMIRTYQTDPKLYEMRGTLLAKLGRKAMAIKSWNQALKLSPQNESLRKFLSGRQTPLSTSQP